MGWFTRYLHLRKEPQKIFPQALSAIVLGSYYRDKQSEEVLKRSQVRIARYAHGKDYHRILRKKGQRLLEHLQNRIPHLKGRVCVDSAPVPEKILARLANLGWQGKHTNLIHPQYGSYFFLSVILVNIDLPKAESEHPDLCKDCRLCVDACPTQALANEKPYRINPTQCISYFTIEHKKPLEPTQLNIANIKNFEKWAFGCDICQEVCPYNRNRQVRFLHTTEAHFRLRPEIRQVMETGNLSPDAWDSLTQGSALRRASQAKLKNNIELAKNS